MSDEARRDELAEAEERLAANRAAREAARSAPYKAQRVADLEALDSLESEHGTNRVVRIDITGWEPGCGSTLVVAKLPRAHESVYKRFQQKVAAAKGGSSTDDEDQLARSCLVYPPDGELRKVTLDSAPGILAHVAVQIVQAVQGKAVQEGK